ncbi:hypothetical protein N9D08_01570 [bacterium]|nr:hypothetical protein [bacterium]
MSTPTPTTSIIKASSKLTSNDKILVEALAGASRVASRASLARQLDDAFARLGSLPTKPRD